MPTTHPPIDGLQPLLDGDPAAIQDPYRIWQQLLDDAPVHREGSRLLLARNGDVRHVEQDAESRYAFTLDQSDYLREWLAGLDADRARDFHDYYGFMNLWLVRTSGEQHTRLRRLAHHAFTPRRVAQMSGAIERFATELVDELVEQDQPDLMDLAYRLPLYVIVDMLGCPASDRERIRDWSSAIGRHQDRADPVTLEAAAQAIREFKEYIDGVVERQRRDGGGDRDLVVALLEADDGERLTRDELAALLMTLLFAGHETTTNLISIGMLELLRNREQWEMLCADPSLTASAVEELLRFVSPVQWTKRLVVTPHDVAGAPVEPGDMIVMVNAAANRDPEVFDDPHRLDITRSGKRHLALGFGPHFCLGASLARLETSIVLTMLAERMPGLQLATEHHAFVGSSALRRLSALPITNVSARQA